MTAAEIVVRLLLGAFFVAAGVAVIMPVVAERQAPLAAGVVLVLITGTMAVAVGVRLYRRDGGGDRG